MDNNRPVNCDSLRIGLLAATLLSAGYLACSSAAWSSDTIDDSEIKHIVYPEWFSESPFSDLEEEVLVARSSGKLGLMVLFTTEGCSYCYLFVRNSLGDPVLAAMVQAHFEAVGLEIFDDREMTGPRGAPMSIKQFADREGAAFAPTLLFYGPDGERLLKVVGYQSPQRFRIILEYLIGGHFRTVTLADFFQRDAAGVQPDALSDGAELRQDPLFSGPPYDLDRSARPARRPLLVIFEKTACAECDQFHAEVLSASDVRETLAEFEIVRLDAGDGDMGVVAPDGATVTPAGWFEAAGFTRAPALVFFSEDGAKVLETDSLVLRQRMMNSLNYVLERAYEKGWTYQRFARSKAIERWQAGNPREMQDGNPPGK